MIPRLRLTLAERHLILQRIAGRRILAEATAEVMGPDEVAGALAQLVGLEAFDRWPRAVDVRLADPWVQCRRVAGLPPVPQRLLPQLVEAQAGRLFRRKGGVVVTDAMWETDGPPWRRDRRLHVLAAAATETTLALIREGLHGAGFATRAIRPAAKAYRHLALSATADTTARRQNFRRATLRIAAIAVSCWVAAGLIWSVRVERELGRVRQQRAALAGAVAALEEVRRLTRTSEAMVEAVEGLRSERGRGLDRLQAISRALPDSTWLTAVELEGTERGRISGVAPRALDVLAALERGGGLAAIRLEGSAVPELVQGVRRERFTIRFGTEHLP